MYCLENCMFRPAQNTVYTMIDIIPEFNLYEEFWKIYTNSANIPPQYIAENAVVDKCIIANGTETVSYTHLDVYKRQV